jgi:hypothetical protein
MQIPLSIKFRSTRLSLLDGELRWGQRRSKFLFFIETDGDRPRYTVVGRLRAFSGNLKWRRRAEYFSSSLSDNNDTA